MTMFSITREPIDTAYLKAQFQDEESGAFTTFEGWVRCINDTKRVDRLEYEAYEPLATKEGSSIIEEVMQRFEIHKAVCCHRVGTLELGEIAVWIGVSAGHREAAFKACRYVIDEVKKRVPIWKKEHYREADSAWIHAMSDQGCSSCGHP